MTILLTLLGTLLAFFILSYSASKKQLTTNKTIHPACVKVSRNGYGKWIGGGIGWAFGGPIGGLLGFMFGSMFESDSSEKTKYQQHPYEQPGARTTQSGDFSVSLLVLSAAVMKADGVVKKSELEFVKRFFVTNFGEEKTKQLMQVLKELLQKEINIQEVSMQVRSAMDYSSRLQLLHYLFGIALADSVTDNSEIQVIENIAGFMGIRGGDFKSVKAMFVKDVDSAYKILEVDPSASDNEIKKAYHKMAIKYHPDKVSHLGDEVRKSAEEKFQQLNAAYDEIKKRRGMV
ncbi:MAG: TerB family tellurite resistance protein [Bacteroidales bacterium]|nr:TerB family tellurite resistance protein [Bacteroidales bacterium]